jgi:NAD(P)-dependent dehydrogenase (short-subunit alcohol dehydrogenase family)
MSSSAVLTPFQRPTLAGKQVIITGASRGIGAACAVACAHAGARWEALIARSEPRLREVARRVSLAGSHAVVRVCDVTDTVALQRTIGDLGSADVLINCAGANQPEPMLDVAPDTFERLWRLNVQSAFFASQAVARCMMDVNRPGVIVIVSSQMGHVGAPLRTVYCATKHALEGLTKALAVELAPHDIRVVSVAPTFVRTEMTAAQLDDPAIGPALLEQIPLGRFATLEQVAAAVVYAASDAAGALTGTSLVIDGGWTAK